MVELPIEKTRFTVKEAAKIARVTDARIRQVLSDGQLRGVKHGWVWLISRSDLEQWLKSREEL